MDQPRIFGNPGELVPQVDPQDVRAAWEVLSDIEKAHPGEMAAIGVDVFTQVCKPGANIPAVTYRISMIKIMRLIEPGSLPWTKKEQLDDAVFRAVAEIPMKWVGTGSAHTLPFDIEDLQRRMREA